MTNLQNYTDAIGQITPGLWSLSAIKSGENSIEIPGDEVLWANFDDPDYKFDRPAFNAALKQVTAVATEAEAALKEIHRVSERVEFFLAQFEKIGVKGLDKTDLLLVLFDAASVRDWGFVSPSMQLLIDKLAPVPTPKK